MKTACFVIVAVLGLGTAGCESKYTAQVVGVWEWSISGNTVVVTVNKDGTGSLQGPGGNKNITWRIRRGNNFVFTESGKDAGFVIESADENTIRGSDPQAPGLAIVWKRKK